MDGARLANKVCIITGAGSRGEGIGNGRATAILMARQGARVALIDADLPAAAATAGMITGVGGTCLSLVADVTCPEACAGAISQVMAAWGRVDVLVNNVGILGATGDAVDVDIDAWDRGMRINLTSMVLMAKHAIPRMRAVGGGAIVNISSTGGLRGDCEHLLYPTSKGAIVNLTRAMAAQHGRQGIRVNCIAPGPVYTPFAGADSMPDERRAARRNATMLGTEGTGWDVGQAAVFLASDEARWITGVILPVDGGVTAGEPGNATIP